MDAPRPERPDPEGPGRADSLLGQRDCSRWAGSQAYRFAMSQTGLRTFGPRVQPWPPDQERLGSGARPLRTAAGEKFQPTVTIVTSDHMSYICQRYGISPRLWSFMSMFPAQGQTPLSLLQTPTTEVTKHLQE